MILHAFRALINEVRRDVVNNALMLDVPCQITRVLRISRSWHPIMRTALTKGKRGLGASNHYYRNDHVFAI